MRQQDDYATLLLDAAKLIQFTESKNGCMLGAEEWYRKAAQVSPLTPYPPLC